MADVVATLIARLEADVAGFKRDLATATGHLGNMEKSTGKAHSALGMLQKAALVLGPTLAAVKIAKFASDSLQMAVSAEEAASAFRTTFGPAVGGVTKFVDEFANKAGFAEYQLQQILATSGNVVQGLGATESESAQLSETMARLAGDVASFSNAQGGAPAVMHALQSALTGEREALKTYGIVVTEVDVQERALRDTHKSSIKELTKLDKANATVAIAMERAGKAVGDLDRTQDSAANTQRRLSAMWKEAQVALGQALLPALDKLLPALEDLIPTVGELLVVFGEVAADLGRSLIPVLKAVVPVLKVVGWAAKEAFSPFRDVINDKIVSYTAKQFDDLSAAVAAGNPALKETADILWTQAATGKLTAASIAEWTKEYEIADETLKYVTEHLAELGVEQKYHQKITSEVNHAIGMNSRELAKQAIAQGIATADTQMAAQASREYGKVLQDETFSHKDNEQKVRAERDAILDNTQAKIAAASPTLQLMEAQDRLAAANATLTQLQRDGKTATKDYEVAQRDLIRAQAELEGAQAVFTSSSGASVQAFIALATHAGLTRLEIDKLLASIGALNTTPVRAGLGGRTYMGGVDEFAAGGPVAGRRPILVGEKGPELFVPNTAGYIVPNGGGGGLSANITINGAGDPRAVAEEVRRVLARVMARNGSIGVG